MSYLAIFSMLGNDFGSLKNKSVSDRLLAQYMPATCVVQAVCHAAHCISTRIHTFAVQIAQYHAQPLTLHTAQVTEKFMTHGHSCAYSVPQNLRQVCHLFMKGRSQWGEDCPHPPQVLLVQSNIHLVLTGHHEAHLFLPLPPGQFGLATPMCSCVCFAVWCQTLFGIKGRNVGLSLVLTQRHVIFQKIS